MKLREVEGGIEAFEVLMSKENGWFVYVESFDEAAGG